MFSRLRRLFRLFSRDAVTLWYACRHPAAPGMLRLSAVLMLLYLFSPIDVIPDWIPVLGWLDDATILAFCIPLLLKLAPAPVLAEARHAAENFLARTGLRSR